MSKNRQVTLADCLNFAEPHYKVVSSKNFVDWQIGEKVSKIKVKDLIDATDVEVIIRKVKDSDM